MRQHLIWATVFTVIAVLYLSGRMLDGLAIIGLPIAAFKLLQSLASDQKKQWVMILGLMAISAGVLLMGGANAYGRLANNFAKLLFVLGAIYLLSTTRAGWSELRSSKRQVKFFREVIWGFWPGVNKFRHSLELLGWFSLIFGGPLLMVWALKTFMLVDDRIYFLGFGLIPLFFIGFSRFIRDTDPPGFLEGWMLVIVRLGMSFCAASLCLGLLLWYNAAMDRTVQVIDTPWIGRKGGTRHTSPRLQIPSLERPGEIQEISIPVPIYEALGSGTLLRIRTGEGALGMEWLGDFEVVPSSS